MIIFGVLKMLIENHCPQDLITELCLANNPDALCQVIMMFHGEMCTHYIFPLLEHKISNVCTELVYCVLSAKLYKQFSGDIYLPNVLVDYPEFMSFIRQQYARTETDYIQYFWELIRSGYRPDQAYHKLIQSDPIDPMAKRVANGLICQKCFTRYKKRLHLNRC